MWRSFADTTPTGRIIIYTLCSVSEKKKSCEFLREKHGRINLFNMKKSRWLLLGARIGVTGAGDNCVVSGDLVWCLLHLAACCCGPSDSDNWQNGLKLDCDLNIREPNIDGMKVLWNFELFMWFVILGKTRGAASWWQLTSATTSGERSMTGSMLSTRCFAFSNKFPCEMDKESLEYTIEPWFYRTWKPALWQRGSWRMLPGRLHSCKKTLPRWSKLSAS